MNGIYSSDSDAVTWAAVAATASPDGEQRRRCDAVCFVILFALLLGGSAAVIMLAAPIESFTVAIDSVSGLDDPAAALISPEFNLTLGVASGSFGWRACVPPGTYLEVAYRCAKLATTAAAPPLCAGPWGSAEQRGVVARGARVRVPGHLVDSLAEGARRGVQVFDVTLRLSGGDDKPDDHWMASCGARQVGAALGGWCDESDRAWYFSCSGPANTGGPTRSISKYFVPVAAAAVAAAI